ncbi:MAG: choice-of-anchor B family protein [Ignavibacteria bacterium]|nr:choice-of-anchor B family protein [Ignavibacteria bacterium]
MKIATVITAVLLATGISFGQLPNSNMYLFSQKNLHAIPPQYMAPWSYSAIWGYAAPDGREYAILGCGLGTAFYDVTDSSNVREVGFFPTPINLSNPDAGVLWVEMKVYSHYAYVVSEADTSGVRIFDLRYLPDSVKYVKKFMAPGHSSTHTISQEGPYLYLNGANASFGQGTAVLDLTNDPENPVVRGRWNTRYVHDSRVLRDTIFAMNINAGDGQITIIDARNKDSLKTITQWLNLPNPSPHNCALTKSRDYLYATEEVGALPRLLKIWDIRDLGNVTQVATWQPTGITTSIVHNVEIYGDTAVIAHYTAGVRVLNIANPASPVEIGWYDTYPQNNSNNYLGCWGVYKLPSGKIIASDMTTGLYVLKMGQSVGISNPTEEAAGFALEQNYPNPFNPVTTISYRTGKSAFVNLKVYDILGNELSSLVNGKAQAGQHKVDFDGSNLATGVYYYSLFADGERISTKRMTLIK